MTILEDNSNLVAKTKVPTSYLTNGNKIEFLNNPDGTISILIINIRDIQGK